MNPLEQLASDKTGNSRAREAMPPLACYANYFEVGHNAFEFLLDVGQVEPQSGEIRFTNRVAISPVHAKLLSELLLSAVEQFEDIHQPIPDISDDEAELLDFAFLEEFERRALDLRRSASAETAESQPASHNQASSFNRTSSLER